jgi:hypothetical protein
MTNQEQIINSILTVIKTCEQEKPQMKDDLLCEAAAYATIKRIVMEGEK